MSSVCWKALEHSREGKLEGCYIDPKDQSKCCADLVVPVTTCFCGWESWYVRMCVARESYRKSKSRHLFSTSQYQRLCRMGDRVQPCCRQPEIQRRRNAFVSPARGSPCCPDVGAGLNHSWTAQGSSATGWSVLW